MDMPALTFRRYFNYLLASFVVISSIAIKAGEFNYSLALLAEFPSTELTNDPWQFIVPLPGKNSHYFVASETGKIFTVSDDGISTQPLIDIRQHFPKRTITALTALVIAPGFHLHNQFDHNTFYTAHVENSDKTKGRLVVNNDHSLKYDAVVTRWQLDNTVKSANTTVKHREIIRIPIYKPTQQINQLSFAEYIEPWNDLYGLLYISLKPSDKLDKSPLHSGVILRINPQQKGNKNYTIPSTNPFLKMANISNEIIFIANESIEKFDWYKKNNTKLVILHNSIKDRKISLANNGDDWRKQQSKRVLWEDNNQKKQNTIITYHGRTLKNLWEHILLFGNREGQWYLTPLILQEGTVHDSTLVQGENLLPHNLSTPEASLSIHNKINGEVLLLEKAKKQLFELVLDKKNANIMTLQANNDNNSTSKILSFVLLILTVLCLTVFYLFYLKKNPQKQRFFLQTQWANFNFAIDSNELTLKKRGKAGTNKTLELSSLVSSELLLNDEVIVVINHQAEHAYTNAIEDKMQRIFANEHRIKMMPDKTRKIQIRITDMKKTEYVCCLYFRIGNIRHTKLKYSQTLAKIIEWNWHFSQIINPSYTEKRVVFVQPPQPIIEAKNNNRSTPISKESQAQELPSDNRNKDKISNKNIDVEDIDTKLLTALDKLVNMKKQGFLDEDEFNAAKKRLLQDFINK